jgi:hypothetical protein
MHALLVVLPVLGIFVIAYRYYSAFIAADHVTRRHAGDAGAYKVRRAQRVSGPVPLLTVGWVVPANLFPGGRTQSLTLLC